MQCGLTNESSANSLPSACLQMPEEAVGLPAHTRRPNRRLLPGHPRRRLCHRPTHQRHPHHER